MTDAARVALDTNVLFYAVGYNDADREGKILRILSGLDPEAIVLPAQAVGEFYTVSIRKAGVSHAVARESIRAWTTRVSVWAATSATFLDALDLSASHKLQFWDALILATAAEAGCRILLSEDMQHGFVWRGCTVVNPFAEQMHPLLADALRQS